MLFQVPRVLLGGWIAVFVGDTANNYVIAKLKVLMDGRALWVRLVASTVGGQFVNTVLFYIIALYGAIPASQLVASIRDGWFLKVVVEIVMIPVTYRVVAFLKRHEAVDYYDRDTDFNPFRLRIAPLESCAPVTFESHDVVEV